MSNKVERKNLKSKKKRREIRKEELWEIGKKKKRRKGEK